MALSLVDSKLGLELFTYQKFFDSQVYKLESVATVDINQTAAAIHYGFFNVVDVIFHIELNPSKKLISRHWPERACCPGKDSFGKILPKSCSGHAVQNFAVELIHI